jgi:prepilin-type N-terminal cleavage/methylation domain-containing protein
VKDKGFTFVEILMVVAIMSVLLMAGAKFFENTAKSWRKNYAQVEIQQGARIAMDEMTQYVRQAQAATVVVYTGATPANSKITFTMVKDTGTFNVGYYLNGTTLWRQLNGVESTVTANVQQIYFAKSNPATIPPDEDPRCIYIKLVLAKNEQMVTLESYTHLKNE